MDEQHIRHDMKGYIYFIKKTYSQRTVTVCFEIIEPRCHSQFHYSNKSQWTTQTKFPGATHVLSGQNITNIRSKQLELRFNLKSISLQWINDIYLMSTAWKLSAHYKEKLFLRTFTCLHHDFCVLYKTQIRTWMESDTQNSYT